MQVAEMAQRSRNRFFPLERRHDVVSRKMTRFEAMFEHIERFAIESPRAERVGRAGKNFIGTLKDGFRLHTVARHSSQIVDAGLV